MSSSSATESPRSPNVRAEPASRGPGSRTQEPSKPHLGKSAPFGRRPCLQPPAHSLDHLDRQTPAPSFHPEDAPPPIDGQRGVLFGDWYAAAGVGDFRTHTMFRRHYHQLIRAPTGPRAASGQGHWHLQLRTSGQRPGTSLRLPKGWISERSTAARLAGVRKTTEPSVAVQSALSGPGLEGAGIAVELPHRSPELADSTRSKRNTP